MKPVGQDYCFNPVSSSEKKEIFNGVPLSHNFWDEFEYFELTTNQRQKDDQVYADMLNRIRVGNQTVEDISLLKAKVITKVHTNKVMNAADHYMKIVNDKPNTITLFSLVALVNEFNSIIHNKLGIFNNNNNEIKLKEG